MDGLSFVTATPPLESDPARADIACFIGFVRRRSGDPATERDKLRQALAQVGWSGPELPASARLLPEEIAPAGNKSWAFPRWLRDRGWSAGTRDDELFSALLRVWFPAALVDWWSEGDYLNSASRVPAVDLLELRDVPAPVDSWDVFDALFAWDDRPIDDAATASCDTAMGAALRSFFAQGGRKCFVVRLGDPWPVLTPAAERIRHKSAYGLLPPGPSPVDRASWRGLGNLFATPEVSFLCLPDLPDLFGTTPSGQVEGDAPTSPEVFIECSAGEEPPPQFVLRGIPPPHCDEAGFKSWAGFIGEVGKLLAHSAREVQFIGAIPLPVDAAAVQAHILSTDPVQAAEAAQWSESAGIATAFVQLIYPWLRTPNSPALPGGLEAPDGVLAGALANSALTRGSWRSALRQAIPGLTAVEPVLDRASLLRLREHITIIGPAPDGFRLLSDVTTSQDESYRPANVNRLINAIIRAARETGTPSVFQSSGPILWKRLRESLERLLAGLWAAGALGGDSAEEAFEVQCDRRTMTQADLDDGRVVCRVSFAAASPIVQITVVFAMEEGGQISLVSQPKAA